MRFAAIADVHGNYLALEAVIADIRAQDIVDIVNLGDMASGPLDARRTMDALMALDAVHVLGNHDRWLIDRPVGEDGCHGSGRPMRSSTRGISTGCARCRRRRCFAIRYFSVTPRPTDDNVYWLETVTPDGAVHDGTAGCDREGSGGNFAVADPVRPHPYRARGAGLATGAWWSIPAASASPAIPTTFRFRIVIEAGTPDARYAILELAR